MLRVSRCLAAAAALSGALCLPAAATSFSTDYTDLWWNPAEAGWGVNLVQQHDTLFATLFVYGPDSTARWYVASALTPGPAAGTFTGPLYQASGPYFGAGAFDPTAATVTAVGSMSVSFASAVNGTLTYSVGGVTVSKPISRQTWRVNVVSGEYRGGLVAAGSGCRSPANPAGAVEAFDRLSVTSDGALVTFRVEFARDGAASTCTFTGTHSQSGRLGEVANGSFTCASGGSSSQGTFAMREVQVGVNGFTAAFSGSDAACAFAGRFGGVRLPAPPEVAVSGLSPFSAACGDFIGTAYVNAEVEPHIAVNPRNPDHWVGNWQQDRWSNGAARGLVAAVTFDGGTTWTRSTAAFSHCTGGNAANGADFTRATDPWVAFSPDGTVHQAALSLSGGSFTPSSRNAMMVSRSTDGGRTWSTPIALIRDGGSAFNDKETITADPHDSRFVYAVWDRLESGNGGGPTWFARTSDGGLSWEPARPIFDPGGSNQTIGNLIRVLPDGTLVNLFTQLDDGPGSSFTSTLKAMRSGDRGLTWSEPSTVAALLPLGVRDPVTGIAIRDGSILAQMAVAPDGALYVAWQDGRFTQARDSIALARSLDAGLTWSAPVRVNADPGVAAFMPQVHVLADGTIGVTYYDFRSDTASPERLMTDYWLARSLDGLTWTETRVTDAFDLRVAPLAGSSLFLGDYMGLAGTGADFVPFYVRTVDTANRSDVFARRIGPEGARVLVEAKREGGALAGLYRAAPLPGFDPGPEFRRAVSDNIVRAMESRIPGWSKSRRGGR